METLQIYTRSESHPKIVELVGNLFTPPDSFNNQRTTTLQPVVDTNYLME